MIKVIQILSFVMSVIFFAIAIVLLAKLFKLAEDLKRKIEGLDSKGGEGNGKHRKHFE